MSARCVTVFRIKQAAATAEGLQNILNRTLAAPIIGYVPVVHTSTSCAGRQKYGVLKGAYKAREEMCMQYARMECGVCGMVQS